jgi:hypoxanthine phosphoribosyltransferase
MTKNELIIAIVALGCKDNLKALKKSELESVLIVWEAKDTGPTITAMTAEVLQIALDKETILAGNITNAKVAMKEHYLAVLKDTGILKENGLPSTSGKLLVKLFHDYPLSDTEDNKPVGLETAKKSLP